MGLNVEVSSPLRKSCKKFIPTILALIKAACKDNLEKFVVIAVLLEYQISTKSMIYLAVSSLKIVWFESCRPQIAFFVLCLINTLFLAFQTFLITFLGNIDLIYKKCYSAQIERQESSAYTITENLYLSTLAACNNSLTGAQFTRELFS